MANSTQSDLKLKLTSKFANTSTRFYTEADRTNALNVARDTLGKFDFPELQVSTTLIFAPTTYFGDTNVASANEPADLRRPMSMFDNNFQLWRFASLNSFDITGSNTWTRTQGKIYVRPSTVTSLNLRYLKKIALFTELDGTTVNEFDPRFDDVIINGAMEWLNMKGKSYNEMQQFQQKFYEDVARMYQDEARQGGWDDHQKFVSVYDQGTPFGGSNYLVTTAI